MMDEQEFRGRAEAALEALKQHLYACEEEPGSAFEVDEQGGVLYLSFEEQGAKFVVTANSPARQIWISALSTSFKLDWDETANGFTLAKSGEAMIPLLDRLIAEQAQA